MANSYLDSFSPSFTEKVISDFGGNPATSSAFLESYQAKFPGISPSVKTIYENGLQGFDSPESIFGTNANFYNATLDLSSVGGGGWTFITAPEDISWDISNNSQRIDIFGTNNPPVVAGSRGMRDLTLSNSLVEGFVRNVQVEGKVAALESLMDYSLNPSDGFVSVPVYQVWANKKSYGGPEAYYIIKDVKVKEAMRDLTGYATRAYVDISLMQVPKYQVNSGRDQASSTTAGARSTVLISQAEFRKLQAQNNLQGQKNTNNLGANQKGSPSGANSSGGGAAAPGSNKPAGGVKDTPSLGFQKIPSLAPPP